MNSEILDIIVRVLSGETSMDDKQKLITWLGQDTENMKAFGQAESVWNALEIMASGKEYNSNEAFEKFKERTRNKIPESGRNRLKKTMDWVIRIAAIIIIITGISYFTLRPTNSNPNADLSVCEVVAPRGSKAQVLLPDGTRVWLNADSKINYRKNFNEKSRDIYLEGEGYFEVAKNPDKPFQVTTSDIRIKALGTSFNVKSYPGENTIETTLIEGKVILEKITARSKDEKPLTLKPNQKLTYYKKPEPIVKSPAIEESTARQAVSPVKSNESQIKLNDKVNAELAIAWKNNRLYFDNESFEKLAVKLERRFNVNIHFLDKEVKEYPFSGRFDDIIIEQVLVALQFASPFYYAISDKDIYISNKPIKDVPKISGHMVN